jgi:hypothetical protein
MPLHRQIAPIKWSDTEGVLQREYQHTMYIYRKKSRLDSFRGGFRFCHSEFTENTEFLGFLLNDKKTKNSVFSMNSV